MQVKFYDLSIFREHGWKSLTALSAGQYRALNGMLMPLMFFWFMLVAAAILAGFGLEFLIDQQMVSFVVQREAIMVMSLLLAVYPFIKLLQVMLMSMKLAVWRIHSFGHTAKWWILAYIVMCITLEEASRTGGVIANLFISCVMTVPLAVLIFAPVYKDQKRFELLDDGHVEPTRFIGILAGLYVLITLLSDILGLAVEGV